VRAWVFGKKFNSSIALRTRAAVAGFTFVESLIVRETVAVETRALFATSLIFMVTRAGLRECRFPDKEKRHCSNHPGAKELRRIGPARSGSSVGRAIIRLCNRLQIWPYRG
jgi:hypothetical protein